MQTRRDQVQAHQFVVSRLTTGLLRADPDAPETPTRRTNRGIAVGALLGAVACVGALVFGLVSPGGNTSWRNGQTLIVEKGTGTRYLYDGRLRPVRNYASARLIVGNDMKTQSVSPKSLAGTPHGEPVGIAGAPDALPSAADLDAGPWAVCAGTQPTDSGSRAPATSVVVDSDVPGTGVRGDQALLVSGPDDSYFLVWRSNRFKLAAGSTTADALGYGAAKPLPVSAAFLDALPAGADLAPPPVPGQGDDGPRLDGSPTRIGQVFVVQTPGSSKQYYLLQHAGLTPITTTEAALALSGPGVREKAYKGGTPVALPVSADALSAAPAPEGSPLPEAGATPPAAPPALVPVDDNRSICVRIAAQAASGTRVSLVMVASADLVATAVTPTTALVQACLAVDVIAVPPDGGSLVRALGSAGGAMGDTTYLVTDTGVKYRISSREAAEALGYDLTAARGVPSPLLNMLPTGPDLSREAASASVDNASGVPVCAQEPAGGRPART
ncbi:type VII secretion protein EccB [Streptomyces sp.]|uniref:type VII secretion protein EccB n=1 Tax=Streptomyces sp. TaxID=1931 RepID=UPI002F401725